MTSSELLSRVDGYLRSIRWPNGFEMMRVDAIASDQDNAGVAILFRAPGEGGLMVGFRSFSLAADFGASWAELEEEEAAIRSTALLLGIQAREALENVVPARIIEGVGPAGVYWM